MLSLMKLNIFQKYCDNHIGYKEFEGMMLVIYPHTKDDKYIENLWPIFTDNPVKFITSRNESGLFAQINNKIHTTNYAG